MSEPKWKQGFPDNPNIWETSCGHIEIDNARPVTGIDFGNGRNARLMLLCQTCLSKMIHESLKCLAYSGISIVIPQGVAEKHGLSTKVDTQNNG